MSLKLYDYFANELKQRTNKTLTKAKIKWADSANLKGITTNKLYHRLTAKFSEMPASF